MVGSRGLAEDVVQDSLLSAYRAIGTFDGRASLKTWLFRIVHNRAIDELRHKKRYVSVPDVEPEAGYFDDRGKWSERGPGGGIEERMDARAMVVRVRAAMDELPHGHRDVLLLKEVHGFSTAEICETLGISAGNIRVRIHRARKALRAAVIDGGGPAL